MSFDIRDKAVVATYITAGNYGYYSIGLDEYDTDAEPELQAGFVEVGGEIYENTAALAITGWAGVAVSTQAYVYIVPGGTTATCIFSSTAPTWSNIKRGWYNSNDRAIFTVYKDSAGTGYCHKQELKGRNVTTGGTTVTSVTNTVTTTWEYSADFAVFEPGTYYMTWSSVVTLGEITTCIQQKINGTYTDPNPVGTEDAQAGIMGDNTVAGGALSYYLGTVGAGVYRVATYTTSQNRTSTLYRAGRLSNND